MKATREHRTGGLKRQSFITTGSLFQRFDLTCVTDHVLFKALALINCFSYGCFMRWSVIERFQCFCEPVSTINRFSFSRGCYYLDAANNKNYVYQTHA